MPSAPTFAQSQRRFRLALVGLLLTALLSATAMPDLAARSFTWSLFIHGDILIVPLLAMASFVPAVGAAPDRGLLDRLGRSRWFAPAALAALLLLCRLGRSWVFGGIDVTRDEQMADFDAFILGHARLWWPLPAAWRPFSAALNDEFLLPVAGHAAWISAYLPVNAALRALLGRLGDADLTSPLLLVGGGVALWRIAGRLWPEEPGIRAAVLLLYACAPQQVVTGMTGYAMTGHLALNLIWLALFLRGGAPAHAAALAIGFLATGLHQPLFHPLFVLPFMGVLLHERRWPTLVAYVAGYIVIILFWLAWPGWVSAHAGTGLAGGAGVSFADRLASLVHAIDPSLSAWLMVLNLLRFLSWQHLLLVPLALHGARIGWRRSPLVAALATGTLLPLLAAAVLMPWQGHGWGYRYLHGVTGNLALLAGFGLAALSREGHRIAPLFAVATAATLCLALPLDTFAAHRLAAPQADLDRRARISSPDIVIVADDAGAFGSDLVANRPDLARPIWLKRTMLAPALIPGLCRSHPRVVLIEPQDLVALDRAYGTRAAPSVARTISLQRALATAGCVLVPLAS